jgi:hypothetical protein
LVRTGHDPESPPDRRDLRGEIVFLDDKTRPRGGQDVVLGHVAVGASDERGQDGNRARTELHRFVLVQHDTNRRIQAKRPERVDHSHRRCSGEIRPDPLLSGDRSIFNDLSWLFQDQPADSPRRCRNTQPNAWTRNDERWEAICKRVNGID